MKSDDFKLWESTLETLVKDVAEIKTSYALKSDIPDVSGFMAAANAERAYAKKEEIPDTSGFLVAQDLSEINQSIDELESKNAELYQNLSIKVIRHTFNEPGQITLLSASDSCNGKIYVCMESPTHGKQYMEYDFKCRLGPSPRNRDALRQLELREQLTSIHKGFNAWCKLEGNSIHFHQYGTAESTFPHKVTIRIIGWANE